LYDDEDSEFSAAADEPAPSGITLVKLTVKKTLPPKSSSPLLTGDYLIYDPLAYEKDGNED
jgi:hypothetical protein